jgi:hypothetical protein
MKSLIATAALTLALVACGHANDGSSVESASSSHAPKLYTVDMTNPFANNSINLFDDGMPQVDGLKVLVPGTIDGTSVTISTEGTASCTLLGKKFATEGTTAVEIETGDFDDDGVCHVEIKVDDGRKATLDVIAMGT